MKRLAFAAPLLLLPTLGLGAPRWQRLSFTGPTDSTMTVSWSDDVAGAAAVEYRVPGTQVATSQAATCEAPIAGLGSTCIGRLTGLAPATAYEYRVSSGGGWSGWERMTTAPAIGGCAPLHFVAAGDTRGQVLPWVNTYAPIFQWPPIASSIAAQAPLLVLHTGDVVYRGSDASQWAAELPRLSALAKNVPLLISPGNHEGGGTSAALFNQLFEYPQNSPQAIDDVFAMVVGNVLIVQLATYAGSMDAQIDWLQTVLEAHKTDVDWRVLSFHAPVWSSGAHGSNENDAARADRLVPLLDQYGVDVVFNGHDHQYERTHPSRGGYGGVARVVTPLANDGGKTGTAAGTVYIVAGGGGALMSPLALTPMSGSAVAVTRLGFVIVDVRGGTMKLTVRDCGGQSTSAPDCSADYEVVTLEKSSTLCPAPADAGSPAPDAGAPPDAAAPADAGRDASLAADAGLGEADGGAGSGVEDGGAGASQSESAPAGCGCSSSGQGMAGPLGGLAIVLLRRARIRASRLRAASGSVTGPACAGADGREV